MQLFEGTVKYSAEVMNELLRRCFFGDIFSIIIIILLTYTTTRVILKPEVIIIKAIDDRYNFMSEIMRYIGASRDSIPRWIATKDMPAHKVGKNWKFKISEIDEWIKSGNASDN